MIMSWLGGGPRRSPPALGLHPAPSGWRGCVFTHMDWRHSLLALESHATVLQQLFWGTQDQSASRNDDVWVSSLQHLLQCYISADF